MKKLKKGFTLVELVIVIAVIAILAAVLIPTFSTVISNANDSAAKQEADTAVTVMISEVGGENLSQLNGAIFESNGRIYEYKDGALTTTLTSVTNVLYRAYAKTNATYSATSGVSLTPKAAADLSTKVHVYLKTTDTSGADLVKITISGTTVTFASAV